MHSYQNYIRIEVPINISDTFANDISLYNRTQTRTRLIYSGCSLFDLQFLYPLFSELTFSPTQFKFSKSVIS